jgi:hypothetical protein
MPRKRASRQASSLLGPRLRDIVARCQALLAGIFNPYRPELYYMRGPGPKWRARHPR